MKFLMLLTTVSEDENVTSHESLRAKIFSEREKKNFQIFQLECCDVSFGKFGKIIFVEILSGPSVHSEKKSCESITNFLFYKHFWKNNKSKVLSEI